MTAARKRHDWEQVAVQTTILANCWSAKGAQLQVSDFPYVGKKERRVVKTVEQFRTFMDL